MSSIKKLIVHYERMKSAIANDEKFRIGITCFFCDTCKTAIKTELVDKGMVPELLKCNDCDGQMTNTKFEDIAPDHPPTWEWYMPKLKQYLAFKKNKKLENLSWVSSGGLLMRAVKTERS